jgi:hypothetical protein
VELEAGTTKRLSELSIGDRIMTSDGAEFSFSAVTVLPHSSNSEPAAFLNFTTETGKSVEMTSDHLIPRCNLEVVTADSLIVGDCLLTTEGKETLSSISSTTKLGVYTAVTENSFLVVNGIVASSHSQNSDMDYPEKDYEKYRLELELQRHRNATSDRSPEGRGLRGV